MAKAPPINTDSFTDFGQAGALYLMVEGVRYEVAQFVAGWAVSELPTAVCVLAVGRSQTTGEAAKVHTDPEPLRAMVEAEVWLDPKGDYAPNIRWPAKARIFRGLIAGTSLKRSAEGRAGVAVHLVHWAAKLGFSSALAENAHVGSPTIFNTAAVLGYGGTGAAPNCYVSRLLNYDTAYTDCAHDVWKAIKTVFCKMANLKAKPLVPATECDGGDGSINDQAITALSDFEGPGECGRPYKWGVALPPETNGINLVIKAIANAISEESVIAYSNVSFWDKLIMQYCPMFGLAVVPRVETAIVIADVPCFAGDPWRTLDYDRYTSLDGSACLERPLRSVGVMPEGADQTFAGVNGPQPAGPIGGCFVNEKIKRGAMLITGAPKWLSYVDVAGEYAMKINNLHNRAGSPALGATTPPGTPNDKPPFDFQASRKLYNKYAKAFYYQHALRGRTAVLAGPLRFDIAPGSVIRLRARNEQFTNPDALADDATGYVQRVSVAIDCNGAYAGTTFQLSHVRTVREQNVLGLGVVEHPLFPGKIHGDGKHGCPLVDELANFQ